MVRHRSPQNATPEANFSELKSSDTEVVWMEKKDPLTLDAVATTTSVSEEHPNPKLILSHTVRFHFLTQEGNKALERGKQA